MWRTLRRMGGFVQNRNLGFMRKKCNNISNIVHTVFDFLISTRETWMWTLKYCFNFWFLWSGIKVCKIHCWHPLMLPYLKIWDQQQTHRTSNRVMISSSHQNKWKQFQDSFGLKFTFLCLGDFLQNFLPTLIQSLNDNYMCMMHSLLLSDNR